DQLAGRMSTSPDRVLAAIERLVREGFVAIEAEFDETTGVQSERYDVTPLYDRLIDAWEETDDGESSASALEDEAYRQTAASAAWATAAGTTASAGRETAASRRKDLFTVFESEFARPL